MSKLKDILTETKRLIESVMTNGITINSPEQIRSKQVDADTWSVEYHGAGNIRYVRVEELWKYKHHDRRSSPMGSQEYSDENIEKLKTSFKEIGLKEPVLMEYFDVEPTPKAFLSEGNHRLKAAIELGMEFLPVQVSVSRSSAPPEAKPIESEYRINRQNTKKFGYYPSELDASFIFKAEALVTGPIQGVLTANELTNAII